MASKGTTVTVLYPRKDSAEFNLEYCLSTHMPLVDKHWKKLGLKSWSVTKLSPDALYSISCHMEWEDSETFTKALEDEGTKEIMGDVGNFSSEQPVLVAGDVVGRSS